MDIEQHEQKFDQSLDQLSYNTTRLTNTLVGHVTERSPQVYVKTKLHLLSCIGALSQAVVKVQQARNELFFFRQKVGLAATEELANPLLTKGQRDQKIGSKRASLSPAPSAKRGRKKSSQPATFSSLSEEESHDRVPLTQQPQTLDKEMAT